jgi:hypothetical protein
MDARSSPAGSSDDPVNPDDPVNEAVPTLSGPRPGSH